MKEIYKDIYTFEVPLPKSALKAINIYVIKAPDRAIVIDTGYNTKESIEYMTHNLGKLGLEIKDCDLLLTHLHADHTGLAAFFYENGCNVYIGKIDGDLMNDMRKDSYWANFMTRLPLFGMEGELLLKDYIGYRYRLSHEINYNVLDIGEKINIGDYELEVVDIKGHTPGHIGFYERNKGFMFAGDTVLDPITPNITFWEYKYGNILGTYINTLKKIRTFNLNTIFSSHRKLIENPNERIDEIIYHHHLRLQEILDSMDSSRDDYTIREISTKISWRIRAKDWDDFPIPQKWFAVGETMAHVVYLIDYGYISEKKVDGILMLKKLKDKLESVN